MVLRPLPHGAVGDRHHGLADQVDLVDLAQFLDNDFVSQFHMGGTQEYIKWVHGPLARITVFGTFRQLRSCGTRRPPPMSVLCLCGVGPTSAPHRTFADPAPPLPTYSATPPPPDPIIPDATHPTCLSALPTTPVYRSRACHGATVGPSVADLCTLGDLPTCGIFVSCVPPVVP